jgi:hypothetical protein
MSRITPPYGFLRSHEKLWTADPVSGDGAWNVHCRANSPTRIEAAE